MGSSASSSVGSLASARDGEPLPLPAGEHAGRGLGLVAEAEQVEQVAGSGLGLTALGAGHDGRKGDVLEHAHAVEQVEELEHDADVAAPHP